MGKMGQHDEALKRRRDAGGFGGSPRLAIAIAASLVALLLIVGVLLATGVARIPGAAARYDFVSIVSEQDVSDYIAVYRQQMGYMNSDDGWASFLAENGMTPASLRTTTIRQLIIDREVEKRAADLGIVADESEVDARLQNMRNNLAFDDDELWQKALAMYGRSEDDLRSMYRHSSLQDALCVAEVEVPDPTENQIARYLQVTYPDGISAKHVYCCTIANNDSGGSYDSLALAQSVRDRLVEAGVDKESFTQAVETFCSDSDLVERGGADGWDLDDDRGEDYQAAVENTNVGDVSAVYRDDEVGVYGFVWIDQVFNMPVGASELDETSNGANTSEDAEATVRKSLESMPDSLKDYVSDCAALLLWQDDCDSYIASLYDQSNPTIYPMPTDAPYNVDMSLAST